MEMLTVILVLAVNFALQDAAVISEVPGASKNGPTFEEWLASFDSENTPEQLKKLGQRAVTECAGLKNDFYPLDPGVCEDSYIVCFNNKAFPATCETTGQVYDDSQKQCVDFSNAKSSACQNPSLTFAPPLPNNACNEDNTDTGLFLPSGTCQAKAYICLTTDSGKTLLELNCKNGQVFNLASNKCTDKEASASCSPPATSTSRPTTATTKKTFSCPSSSGSFPIPGATCCINYYSCSGSVANKVNCPSGYYFEQSKSACISKTSSSSTCSSPITCTY